MRYEPLPSYIRSLKRLDPNLKVKVKEAVDKYIDFFEGGPRPEGLGLKRLSKNQATNHHIIDKGESFKVIAAGFAVSKGNSC